MKKELMIGIVVLILAVAVFFVFQSQNNDDENSSGSQGISVLTPFITANPLDLTQIKSLSKFRSCVGHDYSGRNAYGEKETDRSMKHYIAPTQPPGQVKIFAPFNGEVAYIDPGAVGVRVHLSPDAASDANFIFFHVDLLPAFNQEGSIIIAGQHIGYVDEDHLAVNFDIGMRIFGSNQLTVSPFNYMSSDVLAEYSARGITLENIIKSKADRDSDPCTIKEELGIDSTFVNDKPDDWIELQ